MHQLMEEVEAEIAHRRHSVIPCSRAGCELHAPLQTAVGYRFCWVCHRRYALVELVQHFFPACMSRQAIASSHLGEWLKLARYGSDEDVARTLFAFGVDSDEVIMAGPNWKPACLQGGNQYASEYHTIQAPDCLYSPA